MKNRTNRFSGIGRVAVATAVVLPVSYALGMEYDLSPTGTQSFMVPGAVGGTAIFSDYFEQPTGTGVFQPFLTLDSNGQTSTGNKMIEQAYNTDGHTEMYLDQLRPEWNTLLRVSDLATIAIDNIDYFAFILDANEPGGDKDLISIDNIRIYTSPSANPTTPSGVQDDITKLNDLGTLRWAMNDPLIYTSPVYDPADNLNGFNVDNWIKLDASQENVEQGASNSNGGSGKGDMVVFIPKTDFGSSLGTDDYIWFYNLNGVHYNSDPSEVVKTNSQGKVTGTDYLYSAAEAGYEEWRAVTLPGKGPGPGPGPGVPDSGNTLALFGLGLAAVGILGRNLRAAKAS